MFLFSEFSVGVEKVRGFFDEMPKSTKMVIIPTAANTYDPSKRPWFDEEMDILKSLGFDTHFFDLEGKTQNDLEQALKGAAIVYVSGGNTYYLLEKMRQASFFDVMENRFKEGAIYIGSSAGAAVTGPDIQYVGDLCNLAETSLKDFKALNWVPFRFVPHLDNPKYAVKMQNYVRALKASGLNVIGVNDNQVLSIENNYMEIL